MPRKLKPSGRKSGITNDLWWEVVMRDARWIWETTSAMPGAFSTWFRQQPLICIAPVLDPSLSGTCSGRTTVDHVRSQPGGQRRHDLAFLVSGCTEHNVNRPPSSRLREEHRLYLRSRYPAEWMAADAADGVTT